MKLSYFKENEKASISIDLLTAIAIIIIGFVFAVNIISSITTPYSGYSKELYPAANRAVTLLIENEGYWNSENNSGKNWEDKWKSKNYSDVKKIGFKSAEEHEEKTLDGYKIFVLMRPIDSIEGGWEYPASSTTYSEKENASKALGLGRYNYYLQIRPLNENSYDKTVADQKAIESIGDSGDVVSVVRYSMFNNVVFKVFDGHNIFGSYNPKKVVFVIEHEDFDIIKSIGILRFSISNWNVIDNNGKIQNMEIALEIKNNATMGGKRLSGQEFDMWKNNEYFSVGNTSTSISMPIENSTDYVTIEIPEQTLNEKLPGWEYYPELYIQMNIDKLELTDTGATWFSHQSYPVKIVLWVW